MFMDTESNSTVEGSIKCGLSMDLTWQSINYCYLTPRTALSLLITCLLSFLLALGLEHLRFIQRKYDQRLISKHTRSHMKTSKWSSTRDGDATYELLDQVEEKEDELRNEIEEDAQTSRRRVVLQQCLRGVIQMFVFGIGLVVMIVFMYGNLWIILSTLSGVMVGFALFTKDLVTDGAVNGHGTFGTQVSMWMWNAVVGFWKRAASRGSR